MKLHCIAIDDEPLALEVISRFCERSGKASVQCFTRPEEGLEAVRSERPDLLFLDIRMNGTSGLDLARLIPEETLLVFTTAYTEYALEGFALRALDYLHKPFAYSRFLDTLERAERQAALRRKAENPAGTGTDPLEGTLNLKVEYRNVCIPLRSIRYLEAMDNYVKFHLDDGPVILSQTSLKAVLKQLPDCFLRLHKSYVVPLQRIRSYTRKTAVLTDSTAVPIGKAHAGEFLQRMQAAAGVRNCS